MTPQNRSQGRKTSKGWRKAAGSSVRGEAWKKGMASKKKKEGKKSQETPTPVSMEEFHQILIDNARRNVAREQIMREHQHSLKHVEKESRQEIVKIAEGIQAWSRQIDYLMHQKAMATRGSKEGAMGEIKKIEANIGGCQGKIRSLLTIANEVLEKHGLPHVQNTTELIELARNFSGEKEEGKETGQKEERQPEKEPAPTARPTEPVQVPRERKVFFQQDLLSAARKHVAKIVELRERVLRSEGIQRDKFLSEQETAFRQLKETVAKHNKLAAQLGISEISIDELEKQHEEIMKKERKKSEEEAKAKQRAQRESHRQKKEADQAEQQRRKREAVEKRELHAVQGQLLHALRKRYPAPMPKAKTAPKRTIRPVQNPRSNIVRDAIDGEIVQTFPRVNSRQDIEYIRRYWEKLSNLSEEQRREAIGILDRIMVRKYQGRMPQYRERMKVIIESLESDLGRILGK